MTDQISLAAQIQEAELHALGLQTQAEQQRQNKRLSPEIAERTASRISAAWAIVETLKDAARAIKEGDWA